MKELAAAPGRLIEPAFKRWNDSAEVGRGFRVEAWAAGLIVIGALLRHFSVSHFPQTLGYDFPWHWQYAEWIARTGTFPPGSLNIVTYGHPLHYLFVAGLQKLGLGVRSIAHVMAVLGWLKLVVLYFGLRFLFPRRPLARHLALALATFWPKALHVESMVYTEPLNCLLAACTLITAIRLHRAQGRARWGWAVPFGLASGLGLLTKVSSVMVIAAMAIGALLHGSLVPRSSREKLAFLLPWVLAAGICTAVSGWWFARNISQYGSPVVISFELNQRDWMRGVPESYWDRRRLRFYVGWTWEIFSKPYYPVASESRDRATFFPVLLASTFVDYYNHYFPPKPKPGEPDPRINGHEGPDRIAWRISQAAMVGGTALSLAMVVLWLYAAGSTLRGRQFDLFGALLAPLFAMLGQLHFSTKYPFELLGVTKGSYIFFATLPLFALFGLAVDELSRRGRRGQALAVGLLLLVAPTLAYTIYCRFLGQLG